MVLENQENMGLGGMQGLRLRPTRNKRKRERVAELMARLSERTNRASLYGFSIFCKCGTLFRGKDGKGRCDSLTKFSEKRTKQKTSITDKRHFAFLFQSFYASK